MMIGSSRHAWLAPAAAMGVVLVVSGTHTTLAEGAPEPAGATPASRAAPTPRPTASPAPRPTAQSPGAASAAIVSLPAGVPAIAIKGTVPEHNRAIYLGYKGHVDTDLPLSKFFGGDHTMMAWYMPQYPHGDVGPIVAERDGSIAFGQDDYKSGDGGHLDAGSPVFFVQVGNQRVRYLLPEMIAGKWIHVAVVRKADTVSLYVWGVKRNPVTVTDKKTNATKPAPEIKVAAGSKLPTGTLRFGRRTSGDKGGTDPKWQVYGMIDDVAVFDKALNGTEITSIIAKKRLSGQEAGLLAGWSFEEPVSAAKPLPPKLSSKWTRAPRAYHMPVSADRNSTKDKNAFNNPFVIGEVGKAVHLPFKKNEVWRVIQGQDDPAGSHNGYAAFCYDFMVAGKPQGGTYPNGTAAAPVYSGAPGKIVRYRNSGTFEGQEPFMVDILVGPDEHISYHHLDKGTLHAAAKGGECDAKHACVIDPAKALSIAKDAQVGKQGPVAAHLHFAGSGVAGAGMTIPIAFTNYWASDDEGKTWAQILRGHPKSGQWVKRIE
jgi:hypothetical protein